MRRRLSAYVASFLVKIRVRDALSESATRWSDWMMGGIWCCVCAASKLGHKPCGGNKRSASFRWALYGNGDIAALRTGCAELEVSVCMPGAESISGSDA
jgi:hypothetical protein